jgi:hypothetical protein
MNNNEELKKKLRDKIKQKQIGRKNDIERKKEVDSYLKKIGLSDGDMEKLKELSEKIIKNKTK